MHGHHVCMPGQWCLLMMVRPAHTWGCRQKWLSTTDMARRRNRQGSATMPPPKRHPRYLVLLDC
jgi:hypothetical protein